MTEPRPGPVDRTVASELPGLSLWWVAVAAAPGPVTHELRERLKLLSDRSRGVEAVALRTRPIPRAYRAFARQIGIDPDVDRIAAEQVAIARLMHGGHVAGDRISAACTVAIAETGVGVWALDQAVVHPSGPGIRLADRALVVGDPGRVHAALLGAPGVASAPGPRTRAVVLFAIGVPGVPEIHLREALWLAGEALVDG